MRYKNTDAVPILDGKPDVVEVVFCKDCKHYREYERPVEDFDGFCVINENEYDKDFYCQYGERREK
jgi:hypothetical protein